MYPDCGSDENACFERYIRDRVAHMECMGLKKLKIGTFDNTYDEQFKNVEREYEGRFWWSPHSWNVGTVKDKYVYSFTLFLKDNQGLKMADTLEKTIEEILRLMKNLPGSSSTSYKPAFDFQANPVSVPEFTRAPFTPPPRDHRNYR